MPEKILRRGADTDPTAGARKVARCTAVFLMASSQDGVIRSAVEAANSLPAQDEIFLVVDDDLTPSVAAVAWPPRTRVLAVPSDVPHADRRRLAAANASGDVIRFVTVREGNGSAERPWAERLRAKGASPP